MKFRRYEEKVRDELLQHEMMKQRLKDRLEIYQNFRTGQAFDCYGVHVTWCKPSEIIRYTHRVWLQMYEEYAKWFEGLAPNQKTYIEEVLDGNLCLVPERILWMVQEQAYIVSLILFVRIHTTAFLLTKFSMSTSLLTQTEWRIERWINAVDLTRSVTLQWIHY
jgi:hypothetical protein